MRRAITLALSTLLAACALTPTGLSELVARGPERQLLAGWRAYDEGQYPEAERELRAALALGLASPRDRALAHKLLAFIACSTQRIAQCEQSFRAALAADPGFALGRAETGHPAWGPVYRRVVGTGER